MTMESGPTRCCTRADEKPASVSQPWQSAPVKSKPPGSKGNYVQKISLSSTQGVGVKIDTASVGGAGPTA